VLGYGCVSNFGCLYVHGRVIVLFKKIFFLSYLSSLSFCILMRNKLNIIIFSLRNAAKGNDIRFVVANCPCYVNLQAPVSLAQTRFDIIMPLALGALSNTAIRRPSICLFNFHAPSAKTVHFKAMVTIEHE